MPGIFYSATGTRIIATDYNLQYAYKYVHFTMFASQTVAQSFLLSTRNIENALSTFALDTGKARRTSAQRDRGGHRGHVCTRKQKSQRFILHYMPDTAKINARWHQNIWHGMSMWNRLLKKCNLRLVSFRVRE